jgi:hypothetical protein
MKKYFALVALSFTLAAFLVPLVSMAQFEPHFGPILSCTGAYGSESALPPCTSLCDILNTISNIVKFTMTICLYILGPLGFMYGGWLMISSAGDHHAVSEARKIMTGTVIALALVLGSYVIVSTILYVIGGGADTGVKWPNIPCNLDEIPGGKGGEINPQRFAPQGNTTPTQKP